MKEFNTRLYSNTNLVGFEAALLEVQKKICKLKWMEAVFGIAHSQYYLKDDGMAKNFLNPEEGLRGRDKWTVYFPQCRNNGQDYDMSFSDSYASRVFFLCNDPISVSPKTDTYDWADEEVAISQPFSLIFFGNVDKIEALSTEQLKVDLLYALNQCPTVLATGMSENLDNVWRGFTITQQITSFTRYPYYCLRIECTLNYMAFPFNGNGQYNPQNNFDQSRDYTPNDEPNIFPNTN